MRATEFINESSYDSMIASLKTKYRGSKHRAFIDHYVNFAKTTLRKDERVVWMLRMISSILFDTKNKTFTRNELLGGNWPVSRFKDLIFFFEEEYRFASFKNKGNVKFDNFVFGRKSLMDVVDDIRDITAEWTEKQSLKKVPIQPGDKKLIAFEDGSAWWFLDRSGCEHEARSGKHCGNLPQGQYRTHERLLSYREKDRVVMTFLLDNGILKDRRMIGNVKPDPKYHTKIIALLMLPMIKDMYATDQRDFQLSDLTPEQQQKLRLEKPELFTHTDQHNSQRTPD